MEGETPIGRLFRENKKEISITLLIIALTLLLWGSYETIKHIDCEKKDGFYMTDGTCYIPQNDWERQQLEEKGFFEREPYATDESGMISYWNFTLE